MLSLICPSLGESSRHRVTDPSQVKLQWAVVVLSLGQQHLMSL